jgi:hypothetical protein
MVETGHHAHVAHGTPPMAEDFPFNPRRSAPPTGWLGLRLARAPWLLLLGLALLLLGGCAGLPAGVERKEELRPKHG